MSTEINKQLLDRIISEINERNIDAALNNWSKFDLLVISLSAALSFVDNASSIEADLREAIDIFRRNHQ